jgi:superfamily II DNA helicase RecQ
MVLLFSSPQAILNKSFLWLGLIDWLIAHGRLLMVCVDEVHLFVHFGMTFRDEFKELTPAVLFSKLKGRVSNARSTIPILFMTATCTKSIVDTVEKIVGFLFDKDWNVFWPQPKEMHHHQLLLDVQYSTQTLHVFKKRTHGLLKHSSSEKYILYSNTPYTLLSEDISRLPEPINNYLSQHAKGCRSPRINPPAAGRRPTFYSIFDWLDYGFI